MKNNKMNLEEAFRLIGQTSPKKILFACAPADGHFNPLTGLAKHLQKAGYDVRWYCSQAYAKKLEQLQIHHYPFKSALEVTGQNVEQIFPERKIKESCSKT